MVTRQLDWVNAINVKAARRAATFLENAASQAQQAGLDAFAHAYGAAG